MELNVSDKRSSLLQLAIAFYSWDPCGLYYKTFTIVIYNRNAIGQYYKTTIVDYDCSKG